MSNTLESLWVFTSGKFQGVSVATGNSDNIMIYNIDYR